MFSTPFLFSLVLAFVIGSVWVTLVTVIAERAGSAIGGAIGGLPSTVASSFLLIGFTQSSDAVVQATTVYPLAFGVTCVFLLFYAFFAKRGFLVGFSVSLIAWFSVASLIFISGIRDFGLSLVGGVTISGGAYFVLAEKLRLENLSGIQTHYSNRQLLGRATLAGSLVFLAVLLSQVLGTTIGGIFSAFPAVYTSTLYILHRNRGTVFSRAMTKPLLLSGVLTVIPYCIAVRYTYPVLGIWFGTVISYAVAAPWAFLSYRLNLV
jgi:uncharacterized membrane protein (GlpM family)